MKINSQNDFTSKTAKINHVRSNSKFQIKSIWHDFIFLSMIWFFFQTIILGLNFNVWQEIKCQRKKNQIKNFTPDLKFPIKGSNSKFHITWLLNFDKKFTSWIGKEGLSLVWTLLSTYSVSYYAVSQWFWKIFSNCENW